ncbi:amidohydrolase [uncultured Bosea sp.]|uniref:amidohydrolase n=1 Tax=uncultured Bosea sp. TaxID=211457 RepID=UPI00263AEEBD|nr:amidohydrolase [uncultured Bosea sp.]
MLQDIADFAPTLEAWRRDLHAHPEIAFQEFRTSDFVAKTLASFGIEVHRGLGGTGLVGVIEGAAEGPAIGLRADMDALPMDEDTGLDYRSTTKNQFHGCGHDGHTVMLLAAARHLAANPPKRGKVHLIFQPAEEIGQGAERMIADGLFERFPCSEVYALHTIPLYEEGTAAVRPGPTLSGTTVFEITIKGKGGHGAAPHTTNDPLQVAARLATEISSIVGRHVDPMQPAVISLGKLIAGTASNIIPDSAELSGTIRTYDPETEARIVDKLDAACRGFALLSGCTITCTRKANCPPCLNDPRAAAAAAAAAGQVLGEANVQTDLTPLPFSDDFALMLRQWPGAYIFLGQPGAMCHHPTFDFDDRLLPVGASILCRLVERQTGANA